MLRFTAPPSRSRRQTKAQLRSSLIPLLLLATIGLTLSCAPQQRNAEDRATIKIGFFGDLSGPTFNFGQSAMNGVLMAADEINQAGGINGRKIDIVIEDDKGSPEAAAQVAGKLISNDKVVALIGAGASGNSLAAAPKAQSAQIPLIAPSSTNPAVTQAGDYIFRACFIDAFQGEVMAKFAAGTLKAKKAAIMLDFNSPYSRGLTEYFELSFAKLDGQIVIKQSYSQGDADYRGQLSAIKAAEPEVVYIPGYYGDVGLIAKQARQLGLTVPLLGADGWDAPELWELGGDSLNGSYISNHYSADDPSETIQKFARAYRQRYSNLTPDAHAALAYDALRFLAEAIQKAGTTEGPKLRDALAETKNFMGVTGIISMDRDRNAVKPAVILELQDRKYIYQETIQPETSPAVQSH
ncbi:MAG TPA: ethanolamine utilization protein EutJ [Blastocatellia bacterium]|nr:ethanolamine utilization protein EutJ [Blastocatellia bacterium]HAF22454.1 ethanolamine utilization protein EutJ [Blastocatellia bacterium]